MKREKDHGMGGDASICSSRFDMCHLFLTLQIHSPVSLVLICLLSFLVVFTLFWVFHLSTPFLALASLSSRYVYKKEVIFELIF